MKKFITIEILLLFIFALLCAVTIEYWKNTNIALETIAFYKESDSYNPELMQTYKDIFVTNLTYGIFSLLACLADLAAIILLAFKDLTIFKPLRDKLALKRQAHKAAKAKAEEQAKQARIAALQNELTKLQNSEDNN